MQCFVNITGVVILYKKVKVKLHTLYLGRFMNSKDRISNTNMSIFGKYAP